MKKYDVLIIGSGFAGLGAAALLGKAGVKVGVAEKDSRVGGRAKVIEREGFLLDYGVHSYRHGGHGAAARILKDLESPIEWHRVQPVNFAIRGKELLALPGGQRDGDDKVARMYTREEAQRIRDLVSGLIGQPPEDWMRKSFADYLGDEAENEKFKPIFRAMCLTIMEPDPAKASAGEIILHWKRTIDSGMQAGEPVGGTKAILDFLVDKIEECEGRIILRTRVQELRVRGGKVWEARTSRGNIHADAVIFTAPLPGLFSVIGKKHFKARFTRKCEKLVPTSGVALDYGLSKPISDIKGWLLEPDKGIMGRFPSNSDPGLAPEGKQLSSWFMLLDPEEVQDRKLARSRIKQLRGIIRKLYPEFYDVKEFERILILPVVDGVTPTKKQSYIDRPGFSAPGIENLFLIGDTTAGQGVSGDISWNSAREVVPRVIELLGRG
jgi:phytoene dehydrogenase-like protein